MTRSSAPMSCMLRVRCGAAIAPGVPSERCPDRPMGVMAWTIRLAKPSPFMKQGPSLDRPHRLGVGESVRQEDAREPQVSATRGSGLRAGPDDRLGSTHTNDKAT